MPREQVVDNAKKLRGQSRPELEATLLSLKKELAELRVKQATGTNPQKLVKIKEFRHGIARVKGTITQQQRHEVRKFFEGKKYKPLDLRPRTTRAQRRALTPKQANAKTLRAQKRISRIKGRKFALKA